MRQHAWAGLLIALAGLWAVPAHAVDETTRSAVRQLGSQGVSAYQEGKYEVALDRLERAWAILPTAPLGLWSGRALEASGKLVEASERYMAATRAAVDKGGDVAAQESARVEAEKLYDALQERIPKLSVKIDGMSAEGVDLTVDGRPVPSELFGLPVPVNPGSIEVVARKGETESRQSVQIAEGEAKEVTVVLGESIAASEPGAAGPTKAEAAPNEGGSSWHKPVGWTALGLGGAGLIFGGVTGAIVLSRHNSLCGDDGLCDASASEADQWNSMRTMSTIGFIAGGVLAGAGVTLLIVAPSGKEIASVSPYVGPQSLGLTGSF